MENQSEYEVNGIVLDCILTLHKAEKAGFLTHKF
jgi:hypothetical protein